MTGIKKPETSEEKIDWLAENLEEITVNDWEQNFIKDVSTKYKIYGLSLKQASKVDAIYARVCEDLDKVYGDAPDSELPPSFRPDNHNRFVP